MHVINLKIYILFDIFIVKYNKAKPCTWPTVYFEHLQFILIGIILIYRLYATICTNVIVNAKHFVTSFDV